LGFSAGPFIRSRKVYIVLSGNARLFNVYVNVYIIMNLIIVSDLHIGPRYFYDRALERFLKEISEDCELILNGDIIDNPYATLNLSHMRILDHIKQLSYR
jgi:hypothetical protein